MMILDDDIKNNILKYFDRIGDYDEKYIILHGHLGVLSLYTIRSIEEALNAELVCTAGGDVLFRWNI